MLKKINVSGFKSLDNFSFEFRRGLNVIVGPNGSGKTNIVNFIEFLSNLTRHGLLEAVSRSGGAGQIFRRDEYGALMKKISLSIAGDGINSDRTGDPLRVWYEYAAEIALSENNSTLIYSRQCLKMAFGEYRDLVDPWPVDIEVSCRDGEKSEVVFHRLIEGVLRDQYAPRSKSVADDQTREVVDELLRSHSRNLALFRLMDRYLAGSRQIITDLFGAKSYNISPSAVRRLEDIASEPEIAEDGAGLAATLFALTNMRNQDGGYFNFGPIYFFENPKEKLDQILSYSRIVNDSIQRISVESDPIENKLRIFVFIDYGKAYPLRLPLSLVSDGTAKWLTLITAIITSPSVFAIEEPENFLHPLMQREVVKIVRQTFSEDEKDAFAVMTTHSETILNSVDPDELVLVRMEKGRTIANRPVNSSDIRVEIEATGFGAGYYYIAGAIE